MCCSNKCVTSRWERSVIQAERAWETFQVHLLGALLPRRTWMESTRNALSDLPNREVCGFFRENMTAQLSALDSASVGCRAIGSLRTSRPCWQTPPKAPGGAFKPSRWEEVFHSIEGWRYILTMSIEREEVFVWSQNKILGFMYPA